MGKFRDLTDQVFGRLTVVECVGRDKWGSTIWKCICECGKETTKTSSASLNSGNSKSCGRCVRPVKHGYSNKRTYTIWACMKDRATNINNTNYHHYGGRGIKVCERWLVSFENFLEDMGECPEGMSLDRIDVNGNYEPDNCRWATREQQARNTTRSNFITYKGETLCLKDWSKKLDLNYSTILYRYHQGWSPEECLFGRNKKPSSDNSII